MFWNDIRFVLDILIRSIQILTSDIHSDKEMNGITWFNKGWK